MRLELLNANRNSVLLYYTQFVRIFKQLHTAETLNPSGFLNLHSLGRAILHHPPKKAKKVVYKVKLVGYRYLV